MFPRGDGPLVSIILPTRGRSKGLCESVDSLYSLAKDAANIEFCFRIDIDDIETINTVNNLSKLLSCSIVIAPRGKGYLDSHKFFNQLATVARGDWLFGFNDDATMLTQDWDQVLLEADPWKVPKWAGNENICLLAPKVTQRDVSFEFPFVRRKMHDILGRFSPIYAQDAYLYRLMATIHAAVVFPQIEISHVINDLDDVTKHEGKLVADEQLADLDTVIRNYCESDIEKLRKELAK